MNELVHISTKSSKILLAGKNCLKNSSEQNVGQKSKIWSSSNKWLRHKMSPKLGWPGSPFLSSHFLQVQENNTCYKYWPGRANITETARWKDVNRAFMYTWLQLFHSYMQWLQVCMHVCFYGWMDGWMEHLSFFHVESNSCQVPKKCLVLVLWLVLCGH